MIVESLDGESAIELGQTGFGEIGTAGEIDIWAFRAEAGQSVTISITASPLGPFDSFVELVGPDGSILLASDEEHHEGVRLPRSGVYSLRLRSSDGLQTGLYRVEWE